MTIDVPKDDLTSTDFRERFREQFLSKAAKSTLFRKFMELEQSDMTVPEYVTKFNELLRHGQTIIDILLKKNEKFTQGSNLGIARATIPHLRHPYNIVDMTPRNENYLPSIVKNNSMLEVDKPASFWGKKRKVFHQNGKRGT